MSYGFDMCFKKISSLAKAMEYAKKFVDSFNSEDIKKDIENNYYYIPTNRYGTESEAPRDKQAYHEWNMGWARRLLSIKFVYFKEQKLLGVVGAEYPHRKDFFKTHVYFQNSCDQDYKREDWGKIKYFTDIWDEFDRKSVEEMAELYIKEYDEPCTKEEIIEGWGKSGHDADWCASYYRRSLAYDAIYRNLGLDDWLWGKDDEEKFTRFSLSWITTQERDYFVSDIMKKYEKE